MAKPRMPPLFLIDAAKNLHRKLTAVQRRMTPSSAALLELVTSQWRPRALGVVAHLGIADHLADGPLSMTALAKKTGCDKGALYRVMRALAHDGIFAQPEPEYFALTPISEPLRSDHPGSIRHTVISLTTESTNTVMGRLEESVRTGRPVFSKVYGTDMWTYFETHPEEALHFHRSMKELTRSNTPNILASYDFGQFGNIVDIGGGQGELMGAILLAFPGLRGAVYDFAKSTEEAPATLRAKGVADRCEVLVGNLFEKVPTGYDAYIMKHVVHGLPATELSTPFDNLRQAMRPGAKLLVMEMLVPEDQKGVAPSFLDLQMLVTGGGSERTLTEYRRLLEDGGFKYVTVYRNPSPVAIIEAVKP